MPLSDRLKWPIPNEGSNPWFDAFVTLINRIDGSVFASREDRGITLMQGGSVSFNAATGQLSWSAPIEILSSTTGFTWNLSTQTVTLQDGQLLFIEVPRSPTTNVTVTPLIGSKVSSTDMGLFLAIRRGDKVCWRDGFIVQDGQTLSLFSSSLGVSPAYGEIFISGTATTTVTTAGTPVKAADTTTLGNAVQFDDGGVSNRLRYIGEDTRRFQVIVSTSLERVAGTDPQVPIAIIAKNGTELGSSQGLRNRGEINLTRAGNVSVTGFVELETNDFVEVFLDAITNGDQLAQRDGQMTVLAVD